MVNKEESDIKKARILFVIYFKTMLFAFTGGAVTLPILQEELSKRDMMSREKVFEYYALAQSFPGVIALNSGYFIGKEIAGFAGIIATLSATILPAFFGMLIIAFFYDFLMKYPIILKAINGIRAASVAIILQISYNTFKISFKSYYGIISTVIIFILAFIFKVNLVILVLSCGFFGVIYNDFMRRRGKNNVI